MKESFQAFIEKEKLFRQDDRILLAVSGGIDSVVMLHLFHACGYKIGIAHCNFKLRGKESDSDEIFVSKLAEKYGIPFYSESLNTVRFAKKEGISLQMAARKLRYIWFDELLKIKGYNYVAIAHHQDDEVETFFINLIRGTGIAGLHGIYPKRDNIIRPMLFSCRSEIEKYALENDIKYHEDSSNKSEKYLRNKIRHTIFPLLREINPAFDKTLSENISRIRQIEFVFRQRIEEVRKQFIIPENDRFLIFIRKLKTLEPLEILLFEFLKPFGFNYSQTRDIISCLDGIPGKEFFSKTHRLLMDRRYLIIKEIPIVSDEEYEIGKRKIIIKKPFTIKIRRFKIPNNFSVLAPEHIANIDKNKLIFPLKIRKWQKGDVFYPLGMKAHKLLSDYFIDEKFSIFDKEKTWLLVTAKGDIVWIIGHRIDHRFRIKKSTKKIIRFELINEQAIKSTKT